MKIPALALWAAVLPSIAGAALNDNFDSYPDQASFSAVWTPLVGTGLSLNTGEFVSGPYSIRNPGNTGQSNLRSMDLVLAHDLSFSFSFYDYDGGAGRDYASLYSRGDAGNWTDSLNNLLSIGKYDAITPLKYAGRLAVPGDAVFGDGATGLAGGWFALGGSPERSIGWHTAQITGEWDPSNPGKVLYQFFIDGVLGGSVANAPDDAFNWVVLGSGLTTFPNPIAFDNVQVTTIPEPAVFRLACLGALGLSLRRNRSIFRRE